MTHEQPQRDPSGRFLTLDAMRGVAAVMVVSTHCGQHYGGFAPPLGYLAVDAFFVLSGFVIAYRYDRDFATSNISVAAFMGRRALRLAPLYALGFIVGLCCQLLQVGPSLWQWRSLGVIANLVGLPDLFAPAHESLFPVNPPFWSLFFELWIANLAYASFWRQLRGPMIWAVIGVGAAGVVMCDFWRHDLNVGWDIATLPFGFCRVGFSYFAGVELARLFAHRSSRLSLPAPVILAVLAAILLFPLHRTPTLPVQSAAIILGFPALTYLGASATRMSRKLGALLGDASYALYAIHYPMVIAVLVVAGPFVKAHRTPAQIAVVSFACLLAYIAAKYDERIRRSLVRTRLQAQLAPAG